MTHYLCETIISCTKVNGLSLSNFSRLLHYSLLSGNLEIWMGGLRENWKRTQVCQCAFPQWILTDLWLLKDCIVLSIIALIKACKLKLASANESFKYKFGSNVLQILYHEVRLYKLWYIPLCKMGIRRVGRIAARVTCDGSPGVRPIKLFVWQVRLGSH